MTSSVVFTEETMNELALFAGAGGGILGGHLLGWRTVCAVEWEPYPASILAQRQNDGLLPPFPIWDDVRTFDGHPWRGVVDVVSGGFPCQDISLAGKGAGITGERSGMWAHMARIIGEVRPRFAFVENSPALLTRGLGVVLSDLATLGYDCRWTVLGASDVGAPHRRERFWLVGADTNCKRMEGRMRQDRQPGTGEGGKGRNEARRVCEAVADTDSELQHWSGAPRPGGRFEPADSSCGCSPEVRHPNSTRLAQRQSERSDFKPQLAAIERADWWELEPDVGRVADGVAARVDRLKAIGNGQVPRCAAEAWRLLMPQNTEVSGREPGERSA